jgi:alkylated DNA nucleotide flippase Atl1
MPNPVGGYMVGRWMASCPEDVPWWRVVAKTGHLPVGKRDPRLGIEQRTLLEQEGVTFDGDLVASDAYVSLADILRP